MKPLVTITSRLGKTGLVAGLLTVATSPTARRLIKKAGSTCVRGLSWLAGGIYSGIDRGLRLFGKPGNKVADALFAVVVQVGGHIALVAAPVVHRVARLTDPQAPHIQVLTGISRSFLLHRLLKALISNGLVRVLVEGLAMPALLDSKIAHWLRGQFGILRARAAGLQEQAVTVSQLPVEGRETPSRISNTSSSRSRPDNSPATVGRSVVDDDLEPSNRAERRAQQRHINRQGRNTA